MYKNYQILPKQKFNKKKNYQMQPREHKYQQKIKPKNQKKMEIQRIQQKIYKKSWRKLIK